MTVLDAIEAARVVPVVRRGSAGAARATAERMLAGGLPIVELTATTPGWPEALRGLRSDAPTTAIGVGTVTDPSTAAAALDGGASFLVSPWPAPAVREVALAAGVPLLEGGFTPGERAAASAHGIAKLFPAHAVGAEYLRSVLAVLPGARIMPAWGSATPGTGLLRSCRTCWPGWRHGRAADRAHVRGRPRLHCPAIGKAILASLPRDEADQLLAEAGIEARAASTITTLPEMHRELDRVRERGYAIDDEENEASTRCIGAAVLDHRGRVIGAISVSTPTFLLSPEEAEQIGPLVVDTARRLSATLGAPVPV